MIFFFAGFRGYPEAQADMRVVAGSPQGYAGRGGQLGTKKVAALVVVEPESLHWHFTASSLGWHDISVW